MAVAPSDFCTVAESLFNDLPISSATEGCIRTVAGRAYYAAYLAMRQAARDALGDQDFSITHAGLVSHLKDSRDFEIKAVGTALGELRYFREMSDYWPSEEVHKRSIGLALNAAKGIVRDQKKLSAKLDAQKLRRLHQPQEKPRK